MSKAISSNFSGINTMKIENCQNNGNTIRQQSAPDISLGKTQDTNMPQLPPSGNR